MKPEKEVKAGEVKSEEMQFKPEIQFKPKMQSKPKMQPEMHFRTDNPV